MGNRDLSLRLSGLDYLHPEMNFYLCRLNQAHE